MFFSFPDTSQFPIIPTYDEAIGMPDTGCPPSYDKLPPCYDDAIRFKEPQPSTSTDDYDSDSDCYNDVCIHI